jgi:phosphoribosyl 1,2-cyclic phosphodiesterase
VHCHVTRLRSLQGIARHCGWTEGELKKFDELIVPFHRAFSPVKPLSFEPVSFSHDRDGSHGFVVHNGSASLGYATDLGHVPHGLVERFVGVDVLCIESNYDHQMQLSSSRPAYLKDRIMGGSGHLSNEQAFALVCRILDQRAGLGHRLPGRIVLLHRSRECNCPKLLREHFSRDARIAPRLVLAEQDRRTEWISIAPGEPSPHQQLSLAFQP